LKPLSSGNEIPIKKRGVTKIIPKVENFWITFGNNAIASCEEVQLKLPLQEITGKLQDEDNTVKQ